MSLGTQCAPSQLGRQSHDNGDIQTIGGMAEIPVVTAGHWSELVRVWWGGGLEFRDGQSGYSLKADCPELYSMAIAMRGREVGPIARGREEKIYAHFGESNLNFMGGTGKVTLHHLLSD